MATKQSFAQMKRNRNTAFEKLNAELTKIDGPKNQEDERFWRPAVDKAGNGYAIVRFLAAPGEEDVPFVRIWDHGFKGPGGWYIEKSLTTLGQQDPCSEYNQKLWATGDPADKKFVQGVQGTPGSKRRLYYVSNVYVIKDSANPENEGKVFLFQYGKKIWDKLNGAMHPEFEDEKPMNPFDLWDGANFKIKIRKVDGYRNYDSSEFETPSPLFESDDEIEKVWKSEFPLAAFTDPKEFKSYEQLKARLDKAMGTSTRTDDGDDEEFVPTKAPREAKSKKATAEKTIVPDDDEDEDSTKFFEKLAAEE